MAIQRLLQTFLLAISLSSSPLAHSVNFPHTHKQCVSVRVTNCAGRTQRVAQGPVRLCADVRVQPAAEHRYLVVTWDYAARPDILTIPDDGIDDLRDIDRQNGAIGQAEEDLDGANEPVRIRPIGFKMENLQGGTYNVTARVYTDNPPRRVCASASTMVTIR